MTSSRSPRMVFFYGEVLILILLVVARVELSKFDGESVFDCEVN